MSELSGDEVIKLIKDSYFDYDETITMQEIKNALTYNVVMAEIGNQITFLRENKKTIQ